MLIIAGHLEVDADLRNAFVAAHQDLVHRARLFPGCLDIAITADPLSPTRVNNYERWESREHLEEWRMVADAPDTGIAIHDDHVLEFGVADIRPVFG